MHGDQYLRKLVQEKEKVVGHKITLSRRQLLAHGVWSFAAFSFVPSLLSVAAKNVFADEFGRDDSDESPAFLCFDMAGGAALAGSFLVGKQGGPHDLLKSYSTLGWQPSSRVIDERFGLPIYTESGFFQGMTQEMSETTQSKLRLGSVCHFSALDTTSNPQNISALVNAFGLHGQYLNMGLSNMKTPSGGRSRFVFDDKIRKPVFFDRITQLKNMFRFGGYFLEYLTDHQLSKLLASHKDLSLTQMDYFLGQSGSQRLKERLDEYIHSSVDEINFDPRQNAIAREIWGINTNTSETNVLVSEATVVSNAIDGLTGPGVWTLGGCDYHDGTSTTGDAQDRSMGRTIGRAVEYAARKQKALFFQIITDGSCSAQSGTRKWIGDTNEGMQIMGYYRPDVAPTYVNPQNMQIGHFNDAQAAERLTLVGADPKKASLATFANYCQVCGRIGEFADIAGVFGQEDIDKLLVFA